MRKNIVETSRVAPTNVVEKNQTSSDERPSDLAFKVLQPDLEVGSAVRVGGDAVTDRVDDAVSILFSSDKKKE